MPAPLGIVETVKVVVADNGGNILATSDKGGDVSIVDFRYKFDDEESDECTIKLQTSDPLAFNRIGIVRSSLLQVSWGYVAGPMTYAATVVVRDHETKYGRSQITTQLICSDLLTYLTTARSVAAGEASMIDHLKTSFLGKYNVVIKDKGNEIWSLGLKRKIEQRTATYSLHDTMPIDPWDIMLWLRSSRRDMTKFARGVVRHVPRKPLIGYMPNVVNIEPVITDDEHWYCSDNDPIKAWLEKVRGVIESNRSKFTVIRDLFKDCPNGPWYITGRCQTLLIHNRDFVNKPVRFYTYKSEPSQLIDFTAKTKYDQFEKNRISSTAYDPSNQNLYKLDTYLDELFSMVTFKEIYEERNLTEEGFKKWLKRWVDLVRAHEKWQSTRTSFSVVQKNMTDEGVGWTKLQLKPRFPSYTEISNPDVALQDNTNLPQPSPYYDDVAIITGFHYARPLQFIDDRSNFIANETRKAAMEKEEANIKVVGDPFLQSQMRVQIGNVFKQHKGLYYIKKCEHIITHQGYKTEMDCLKVLSTNRLASSERLEKAILLAGAVTMDAEKQFIKEELLFGKPIIIEVTKPLRENIEGTKGYVAGLGYVQQMQFPEKTIYDIQEELDDDEFIEKITKLWLNSDSRIAPNVEEN